MAEYCKKCFIRINHPSQDEIKHLVLSRENDCSEGSGKLMPLALYIDIDEE